jgi:hypothetical protein
MMSIESAMLPFDADTWIDTVCDRVARRTKWSPIGARAEVVFDDSADFARTGSTVCGTIRACDVRNDGTPTDLLIELDGDIIYVGHYARSAIHWLVTRPCLRWRTTNCLLLGWSAVRIMDAPSFRDATYDKTVGTGRVHLL